jgi:hypothetical protein
MVGGVALLSSDGVQRYATLQQWRAPSLKFLIFFLLDSFKREKECEKEIKEREF